MKIEIEPTIEPLMPIEFPAIMQNVSMPELIVLFTTPVEGICLRGQRVHISRSWNNALTNGWRLFEGKITLEN